MTGRVHIVGAGLAGLAAAIRLQAAGAAIAVHEATDHAGGRCRSYYEPALETMIDNGNHLLLSGNSAALGYLAAIGADGALADPGSAAFDFAELATGKRWQLRLNDGQLPWWVLVPGRRVPGSRLAEYLAPLRLLQAPPGATIGAVMDIQGVLYRRLWQPLLLAALNTEPEAASAGLAAAVLRETLLKGGRACRPLFAAHGLASAFVDPAVERLAAGGAPVGFGRRLRRLEVGAGRITALEFAGDRVELGPADRVILAVPPWVATQLLPDLPAPAEFRAIVNGHFRIAPPPGLPRILAVIGGTVEWLFAFADRLSVTISGADRLIDLDREILARQLWAEVARVTGLPAELPPWQIVKEKRATFAALPAEEARRPPAETAWPNLLLAGDWTRTGLPATIEGAVRSGNRAAELAVKGLVIRRDVATSRRLTSPSSARDR